MQREGRRVTIRGEGAVLAMVASALVVDQGLAPTGLRVRSANLEDVAMSTVSNMTPLLHAVRIIQQPWLGLDAGSSWYIFIGIGLASAALSWRFFSWE